MVHLQCPAKVHRTVAMLAQAPAAALEHVFYSVICDLGALSNSLKERFRNPHTSLGMSYLESQLKAKQLHEYREIRDGPLSRFLAPGWPASMAKVAAEAL